MRRMKAASLVLDFDFYPRQQVDTHHVGEMREAYKAGTTFPPVIIDKKSKRVVDGFHRIRMVLAEDGPDAELDAIEKAYKNDGELLLDAMRYNADHGRALSSYDRAHALLLAGKFKLTDKVVADALHVTVERIESLRVTKLAIRGNGKGGQQIAIKRTIRHMAGKRLSKPQVEANEKLGGMNQLFYVNQLVLIVENGLLEPDNDDLIEALRKLHGLLDGVLAAV